jgi:hypothetical protein
MLAGAEVVDCVLLFAAAILCRKVSCKKKKPAVSAGFHPPSAFDGFSIGGGAGK